MYTIRIQFIQLLLQNVGTLLILMGKSMPGILLKQQQNVLNLDSVLEFFHSKANTHGVRAIRAF